MLALVALVVAGQLNGAGLSVTLPPGWHGRVSLQWDQARLAAETTRISLRVEEVGNAPGSEGFLPTQHVVLRRRDLRSPRLAIRRLAVHGRSFVVSAKLGNPRLLDRANRVLARLRIAPPAGLGPAARKQLLRPLRLPRLRTGGRCPTSRAGHAAPRLAFTLGPGPVYPNLGAPAALASLADDLQIAGLRAHETLWGVTPKYRGAILIRGRRLDGRGILRFNARRLPRSWLPGLWREQRSRWRYAVSTTFIPRPGCYAFQVDGTSFSRRIVFVAR